jgi:2-iminobutanoate/2-iminopropanoate deaminase
MSPPGKSPRAVESGRAPAPIGPYSQALEAGEWLFCSGQIGLDPQSRQLVAGGVREEARQALINLGAVLAEAGLGFEDVVKTTLYLADLGDFSVVNEVYGEFARSPYPARATVGVAALPRGAKVEIEAIARRRS